jgi:hypothetical protein
MPEPKPSRVNPTLKADPMSQIHAKEGPQVILTYYHKMRHQRPYPLWVEWQPGDDGKLLRTVPVRVRPVIAGAVVTPTEQTMGSNVRRIEFHVTPLALGKLPSGRLELSSGQGELTVVPLPMKSVRQRLAKALLLLAIVIPVVLLYFAKYEPLEGELLLRREKGVANDRPGVGPAPNGRRQSKPAADRDAAEPFKATILKIRATHGQMLEYYIVKNVPEIPGVTQPVAAALGDSYQYLCVISQDNPIAFYVGLVFLLLSGTSWVNHLSARARRRSGPLALTPPGLKNPASESTHNASAEAGEMTLIEPAQG